MGKKATFVKNTLSQRIKFAEFALNNICVAKCKFCSIWQQKPKVSVDLDRSLQAIEHLSKLGLSFITLTGGEPLLHPHFDKILQCCTDNRIISTILVADARLLTQERLDKLAAAETDMVCISIDHHSDEVVSESRGIKNLMPHLEQGVEECRKRGLKCFASVLISNYNHTTLPELFEKCMQMGFDHIGINYPEFSESPVYTLGGDAISLSKEEIITALTEVKKLKKRFKIMNPVDSLDNIITFLKGEKPKYLCLGGYKTFFIDWHFNIYPCMHHGRALGNILELTQDDFKYTTCNDCNMSWYRDLSVFFQGFKSLRPVMAEMAAAIKF